RGRPPDRGARWRRGGDARRGQGRCRGRALALRPRAAAPPLIDTQQEISTASGERIAEEGPLPPRGGLGRGGSAAGRVSARSSGSASLRGGGRDFDRL